MIPLGGASAPSKLGHTFQVLCFISRLKHIFTSTTSFLWLCGIPGSGKTILSSITIQSLLQHCAGDPGKAVAYFVFWHQLFAEARPGTRVPVIDSSALTTKEQSACGETLLSSHGNGQRQPSLNALLEVLQQVIKESMQSYIVIDTLDECSDRSELIYILKTIEEWRLAELQTRSITTSVLSKSHL